MKCQNYDFFCVGHQEQFSFNQLLYDTFTDFTIININKTSNSYQHESNTYTLASHVGYNIKQIVKSSQATQKHDTPPTLLDSRTLALNSANKTTHTAHNLNQHGKQIDTYNIKQQHNNTSKTLKNK